MARESKKSLSLNYSDFDIAGNVFRAWRSDDNKLICVVDETLDEYKPNVLLVMEPDGDRKWDDILVNDYGLNLEDIRPKKDNKYQKLDIEYSGLEIYDALIRAYMDDKDTGDIIADLIDFRDAAVRRAATARLNSALEVIEQSNETIQRAGKSVSVLRERRRKLRNRLAKQKENIGREPTKQSAAKILRTESQLESNAEKLLRAESRIKNAQNRIDIATEDANAARDLLAHRRATKRTNVVAKQNKQPSVVMQTTKKEIKPRKTASLPVPDYEIQSQPQDTKMSDSEEVKPLFDKDPEILDEEIAFKPVAFDEIKSENIPNENSESPDVPNENQDVARPLELSQNDSEYEVTEQEVEVVEPDNPAPVLETITTVQESKPSDTDTTGRVTNTQYSNTPVSRPVSPATMVSEPVAPVYPRSPISGGEPVRPVGEHSHPTFAYYLLLILLIALSIFTLWLYQKKNGATMPSLNAPSEPVIETVQPEPVNVEPALPAEPEPVVVEPDIPVVLPEPEPEPVAVPDTPIEVRYPNEDILRAAAPDVPVVESEEDVLLRKDPYYVSRDDQVVYVPVEPEPYVEPEPEARVTNVTAPSVIYDDDIISVPVPAPEYDDSEYYYEDTAATYQPANNQYNVNEYNEYSGGFVDDGSYTEQYNEQYYDESGPETRRHLSIHDGGQYSISYDETTY